NLQYKGTMGPVAVGGGIQYAHGQSKNNFGLAGGTEFSNQTFKDFGSMETGVVMNYAGFQFALQYDWYGQSGAPKHATGGPSIIGGSVDTWGWSTGLEYFMGPWVVGGYYWYGRGPGTWLIGTTGTAAPAGAGGEFEFNYYAL